jgi:hypothetical protein
MVQPSKDQDGSHGADARQHRWHLSQQARIAAARWQRR